MQGIGDLLRTSLGRSLASLSLLDRLAVAWPIAAGHAISERSEVTSLEAGTVTVTVADPGWQQQLRAIGPQLQTDLARISRVPLTAILFVLPSGQLAGHKPAAAAWPQANPTRARKAS